MEDVYSQGMRFIYALWFQFHCIKSSWLERMSCDRYAHLLTIISMVI